MGTLHFATYFDQHYLLRGLALYRSLTRHSPPFQLWVLCLDYETEATLARLALPNVELVPLSELEQADPELPRVRETRNSYEYFWTCGPAYLLYLFERQPEIELLTYLDADMFVFEDPFPIYEQLGDGTILMVASRRGASVSGARRNKGRYNVAVNLFRRTPQTLARLRRWREQCLEWCYDVIDPPRYGDQAYLDDWPERYEGVVVGRHKGVGLATWNLENYRYRFENGRVLVDGEPLIAYHFSRIRWLTAWLYYPGPRYARLKIDPVIRRHVYVPYARELRTARRQLEAAGERVPPRDSLKWTNRKLEILAQMARERCFLVVTDSFAL